MIEDAQEEELGEELEIIQEEVSPNVDFTDGLEDQIKILFHSKNLVTACGTSTGAGPNWDLPELLNIQ